MNFGKALQQISIYFVFKFISSETLLHIYAQEAIDPNKILIGFICLLNIQNMKVE